jgi:tripartite-type tricarboxylate transporter receptor subunit TctC
MTSRRQVVLTASALAATALAGGAMAQTSYPERLVKIVVGNAPGGNDDSISRFIAEKLSKEFGQTVIVENRVGGSTSIAGAAVAAAPPDGYTLMCLIGTGIVQTVLRDKLPYKLSSFVPIVGIGGFPLALAVSAKATPKISNLRELTAVAHSPEGISYASGGIGTMAHLNTVRLLKAIQGKGVHVSYRNNPEGLNALVGGFTQMMLGSVQEVAALRGDDKLRVLAVTSEQRLPMLPDVPTMRELGFPNINPTLWYGYVAPAGTPPAIVSKLADAITRAVRDPAFQSRYKPLSFVEDIKTGDALTSLINADAARWKDVIAENKIQVE